MSFDDLDRTEPRFKDVGLWVVTGVLTGMFLLNGTAKLMGAQMQVENFARWGYPEWFLLLIGSVEVVAGLALLWRLVAPYAAGVLGAVMMGGIYTHLANGEALMAFVPAMFLSLLLVAGWARRPDWLRKGEDDLELANGSKRG